MDLIYVVDEELMQGNLDIDRKIMVMSLGAKIFLGDCASVYQG
jgi:hypothetical protein